MATSAGSCGTAKAAAVVAAWPSPGAGKASGTGRARRAAVAVAVAAAAVAVAVAGVPSAAAAVAASWPRRKVCITPQWPGRNERWRDGGSRSEAYGEEGGPHGVRRGGRRPGWMVRRKSPDFALPVKGLSDQVGEHVCACVRVGR